MPDQDADIQFTGAVRSRIQSHLQALLARPEFAGSRRRREFLRYVVEESLAGRASGIKESTIAVNVFGRSSDFDSQSESIVRVTACEVRKRLAQVYAAAPADRIRIELPLGSYQPVFHVAAEPAPAATSDPPRARWRWAWAAAAIFGLGGLLWMAPATLSPSPLDRFWQPFLHGDRPVLISLQTFAPIHFRHPERWLPLRAGMTVPVSELRQLEASYVGTGAALGAALFSEQLMRRGQRFSMKFGEDLSFADLKTSPAIIIGPSRWVQELTRPLRFQLSASADQIIVTVFREFETRCLSLATASFRSCLGTGASAFIFSIKARPRWAGPTVAARNPSATGSAAGPEARS